MKSAPILAMVVLNVFSSALSDETGDGNYERIKQEGKSEGKLA